MMTSRDGTRDSLVIVKVHFPNASVDTVASRGVPGGQESSPLRVHRHDVPVGISGSQHLTAAKVMAVQARTHFIGKSHINNSQTSTQRYQGFTL